MRVTLLFIFTLCVINATKAQTLEFTYDPAGNQIQRELVTISVNSITSTNSTETEQEEEIMLPKSNSINDNSTIIELYPNLVVDLLNVESLYQNPRTLDNNGATSHTSHYNILWSDAAYFLFGRIF